MNFQTFVGRYPEFETASPELIQSHLDSAALNIDSGVFGTQWEDAHGLLTAHSLWASPFGVSLRLEGETPDDESRYLLAYKRIARPLKVARTMIVL